MLVLKWVCQIILLTVTQLNQNKGLPQVNELTHLFGRIIYSILSKKLTGLNLIQ